jgi:LPXTG-motif cell wall-anchored protein
MTAASSDLFEVVSRASIIYRNLTALSIVAGVIIIVIILSIVLRKRKKKHKTRV